LINSYNVERLHAAEENLLNSSRATDFLTPKTEMSRVFRDAVLDLVEHAPFARPLVNSGRLSVPAIYDGSPLNGPDDPSLPRQTRPGAPLSDAPTDNGWLLELTGNDFTLLCFNTTAEPPEVNGIVPRVVQISTNAQSQLAERYLGRSSRAIYLIRPDQHIAARWTETSPDVKAALKTALAV